LHYDYDHKGEVKTNKPFFSLSFVRNLIILQILYNKIE